MDKLIGALCLLGLFACKNTTVELGSTSFGNSIQAPPILTVSSGPAFAFTRLTGIPSVDFDNSGGLIDECTVSPSTLPAGLSLSSTTCQITGTPSAVLSTASSFQIKATNAFGDSNIVTITIQIYEAPIAAIDLGDYAGSGTLNASGDHSVTLVNALINGAGVINYEAKILVGTNDCTQPGTIPSAGDSLAGLRYIKDISDKNVFPEGSLIKLCVIGKNFIGASQSWARATTKTWRKSFETQDLLSLTFPNIAMHSQPASTFVKSRKFYLSDFASGDTSLNCVGCLIYKNGSTTGTSLSTAQSLSDFFEFGTTSSSVAFTDVSKTINVTIGSGVTRGFQFLVRTEDVVIPIILATNKVFLSKRTMVGNFNPNSAFASGRAAADEFCRQEAISSGLSTDYPWIALISGSSADDGILGLDRIGTGSYYDTRTGIKMIDNRFFVNSFTRFVDNSLTNGGGTTEWRYLKDAPRVLAATQFWYGDNTCNCTDWSSTAAPGGGCSTIRGGVLSHDSQDLNYLQTLPQSPTSAGSILHGYCGTPKHVVCSQSPP